MRPLLHGAISIPVEAHLMNLDLGLHPHNDAGLDHPLLAGHHGPV